MRGKKVRRWKWPQASLLGLACLSTMLTGAPSGPAKADEYIETVRITCIPEIPLLQIEYVAINDASNFLDRNGFGRVAEASQWQKLRKYGYVPARRFDVTCKLPNATYRIWGHRPNRRERGECGGDPRASLSVARADILLIDKVYLEPSCFNSRTGHLNPIIIYGGLDGRGENVSAMLRDNEGKSEDLWSVRRQIRQSLLDCIVTPPHNGVGPQFNTYMKLKTCP